MRRVRAAEIFPDFMMFPLNNGGPAWPAARGLNHTSCMIGVGINHDVRLSDGHR